MGKCLCEELSRLFAADEHHRRARHLERMRHYVSRIRWMDRDNHAAKRLNRKVHERPGKARFG